VVYSGVYGIIRVVYTVFGPELMSSLTFAKALPWIASFTILVGVMIATRQDVLKKRLAYHTISQLSYILLGAFTLQPLGLSGAMLAHDQLFPSQSNPFLLCGHHRRTDR